MHSLDQCWQLLFSLGLQPEAIPSCCHRVISSKGQRQCLFFIVSKQQCSSVNVYLMSMNSGTSAPQAVKTCLQALGLHILHLLRFFSLKSKNRIRCDRPSLTHPRILQRTRTSLSPGVDSFIAYHYNQTGKRNYFLKIELKFCQVLKDVVPGLDFLYHQR